MKEFIALALYQIGYQLCGLSLRMRGIDRKHLDMWWARRLVKDDVDAQALKIAKEISKQHEVLFLKLRIQELEEQIAAFKAGDEK